MTTARFLKSFGGSKTFTKIKTRGYVILKIFRKPAPECIHKITELHNTALVLPLTLFLKSATKHTLLLCQLLG